MDDHRQSVHFRNLTLVGDKLSAIAGLAEHVGEHDAEDVYLAGLWKSCLPGCLMWSTALPPSSMDFLDPRAEAEQFASSNVRLQLRPSRDQTTSPSWSWSAVGFPVHINPLLLRPVSEAWAADTASDLTFSVAVHYCSVEVADKHSPYGAVISCRIRLNGYVDQRIGVGTHFG